MLSKMLYISYFFIFFLLWFLISDLLIAFYYLKSALCKNYLKILAMFGDQILIDLIVEQLAKFKYRIEISDIKV